MFNRYHGFIYPSSNNKKTNKPLYENDTSVVNNKSSISITTQSGQPITTQPPVASGLPIITIPEEPPMFPANPNFKLPNIKVEDYKDIFEPKEEIKYIPPEIIPKETEKEEIQLKQIKPDFQENQPRQYIKPDFQEKQPKQYNKPDFQGNQPKQYIKPDFQGNQPKQYIKLQSKQPKQYDKSVLNKKPNFSSLDKYKINIDNRKLQKVEIPDQKKKISIKKEFPIKTPEIIAREQYIKSKSTTKKKPKLIKKPISKSKLIQKPISKSKLIQKPISKSKLIQKHETIIKKKSKSKEKVNDVLSKIEMSDLDYKKKFEKLKKVYLKQHDSLVNVFDGYQKLYEKVKKEDQIK
jgi:hypothetical protein